MDAINKGLSRFVEVTLQWLPILLGALVIMIIGWIIAGVIKGVVHKLLSSMGLNNRLKAGQGGSIIQKAVPDPAGLVAAIAYWAVLLGTISVAVSVLGISALTNFVGAIYSYLPNVLAALLIFLVAGAVATAVAAFASRSLGDTATGKLVSTVVPVIVMSIATFMILDQLMISPAIITITYAALMGSAALGLALAFGLGGRDVAAHMLNAGYRKGIENSDQIKRDMALAKNRTKASAREVVDRTRRA